MRIARSPDSQRLQISESLHQSRGENVLASFPKIRLSCKVPVDSCLLAHSPYLVYNAPDSSGTVHDNISYGLAAATREQVEEAARMANCEFIWNLPQGFDTNSESANQNRKDRR